MGSSTGIDKEALYGRYQKPTDQRAQIDTDKRQWQSKLAKQIAHKALDEPMLDDGEMDVRVDNRRSGLGWKELTVLGSLGLGALWLWNSQRERVVEKSDREVIRETAPAEPHTHTDRDSIVIPRLTFGP